MSETFGPERARLQAYLMRLHAHQSKETFMLGCPGHLLG
ncbi:hypothetical protein ACS15_2984 [Ralstonia insidiosa]|uniref:Uncharacterized protein n=1 Tax=Ralstonia insidiosa TaxID=190721 RepID=A0AAC9BGD3_9RALS|nr:hypothetical protein ACS15_2984 [Ralstonia insidiosa]